MLALLTATLLTQTYPVLTNASVTAQNTPQFANLSIIGAGTVYAYYTRSGTASGNMTITLQALGTDGNPFGPVMTTHVNPSTTAASLSLSPFTGVGAQVIWTCTGPNDFFNGVTLVVQSQPITDGGGGGGGINYCADGGSCYLPGSTLVDGNITADGTVTVPGGLCFQLNDGVSYCSDGSGDAILAANGNVAFTPEGNPNPSMQVAGSNFNFENFGACLNFPGTNEYICDDGYGNMHPNLGGSGTIIFGADGAQLSDNSAGVVVFNYGFAADAGSLGTLNVGDGNIFSGLAAGECSLSGGKCNAVVPGCGSGPDSWECQITVQGTTQGALGCQAQADAGAATAFCTSTDTGSAAILCYSHQ